MIPSSEFKPKSGYVYVVTNECLKLVNAKGIFRGRKVKAVKIGNAKDFTNRLGSLNTAVYENFDFHLGIKTDDVVGLEGLIHTALQDYRIYTRDGNKTEFFACPLEEVIFRIKKLISRGHKENVEEYKGGKVIGRHGAGIRANIERQQLRRKKAMTLATDKAKCARDDVHKKGRAFNYFLRFDNKCKNKFIFVFLFNPSSFTLKGRRLWTSGRMWGARGVNRITILNRANIGRARRNLLDLSHVVGGMRELMVAYCICSVASDLVERTANGECPLNTQALNLIQKTMW